MSEKTDVHLSSTLSERSTEQEGAGVEPEK